MHTKNLHFRKLFSFDDDKIIMFINKNGSKLVFVQRQIRIGKKTRFARGFIVVPEYSHTKLKR